MIVVLEALFWPGLLFPSSLIHRRLYPITRGFRAPLKEFEVDLRVDTRQVESRLLRYPFYTTPIPKSGPDKPSSSLMWAFF